MFKKIVIFLTLFLTLSYQKPLYAHQPIIVDNQTIQITDPETSYAFYDQLNRVPQRYFIESQKNFDLYINLLVPLKSNPNGRYSAKVYDLNDNLKLLATVDGTSVPWSIYYETFAKDYYYKGPEFNQPLPAGKYAIDIYSGDNQGKYVLAIGKNENFSTKDSLSIIGILRDLKINFFNTSPFILVTTLFGIAYLSIIFIISFLIFLFYEFIIHINKPHTLLSKKTSPKNKLTKSLISIIFILISLYTWNPLVIFLTNILIISTTLDFLPKKKDSYFKVD